MTSDRIADIGNDLINNMPDVQPHAVEAEKAEREQIEREYSTLVDKYGRSFDPSIHTTDSDGRPKISGRNGKLCIKPGKGGGQSRPGTPGVTTNEPKVKTPELVNPAYMEAARATVDTVEALGMMIGGDEWRYIHDPDKGIDQRTAGYSVWSRYYEEKGIEDVPPGLAILMWSLAYALPNLVKPKTKSRLEKVKDWIKIKLFDRSIKRDTANRDQGDKPQKSRQRPVHVGWAD